MALKLVTEVGQFDNKDFEILLEKNENNDKTYYIQGPYMAADIVNRNKRRYLKEEMENEASRYIRDYVNQSKAYGELNHPQSAEVNLERATDLIVSLKQDGNIWIGKSKILDTPCGKIIKSIMDGGGKFGKSTRCLGVLSENMDESKTVHNMKLIAIDTVSDPSYGDAWVNGILENKEFIISGDSDKERIYESFEDGLKDIPTDIKREYIKGLVLGFINNLKK